MSETDVTGYTRAFPSVTLTCEVRIAGETVRVEQHVARPVYDDPVARPMILKALREQLIREIVEKWTPVVTIR